MKTNDYVLAKILWNDAETYGDSSWIKLEEGIEQASTPPPVMASVGWIIYEDAKYVALTSDLGDEECGHITKIPKTMIIKMETWTT